MIKITPELVKQYTYKGKKHPGYEICVEHAKDMATHADALFPHTLIGERRPSESLAVFNYRQKIYESITSNPFSKIHNSLAKIRKSQDWAIQYRKDKPAKIADEETLEEYCEENFPTYKSVTNWTFSVFLKHYLVDSNSLIVLMPINPNAPEGEYKKPFPFVFRSAQVLDYIPGELAVLHSDEKSDIRGNKTGNIYYFFTSTEIWRAKEVAAAGNGITQYELQMVMRHDLNLLPCVKVRSVFDKEVDGNVIYKSRLSACLPSWNEAVREYSDMQASVVKHMFPTLVIHSNQVCKTCSGTGKYLQKEGQGQTVQTCNICKGSGSIPRSPYEDIQVNAQKAGEVPLPSPIAYYVEKDTGIIKIQDERIDKHLYRAYSAVSFEFLASGLNQSGIAKELDRSELNAFIYDVAEDIVAIMDEIYYLISEWRYQFILSPQERKEQLPHIVVPEKYDIISETYLADQIKLMKESGANPFIINALEIEYANKKFNTDTTVRDLVKASLELDPLTGDSPDVKQVKAMNKWVSAEDLILSANIIPFIRRAMNENDKFLTLPYDEKMEILRGFAKETSESISATSKVKAAIEPPAA